MHCTAEQGKGSGSPWHGATPHYDSGAGMRPTYLTTASAILPTEGVDARGKG